MHDVLMKDASETASVSKKTAAMFLLITMFIGSISGEALAFDETIAAPQPETGSVLTVLNLSESISIHKVDKLPFPVHELEPINLADKLAFDIPEFVLVESNTPSIIGLVTSEFGWRRHPIRKRVIHHNGLDLAAKIGERVLSPAAGVVIFSGVRNGYGNTIEIDHGDGLTSLLAHHSKLLVQVGQQVTHGQVIALAGRTGRVTGPHVHIEIRKHGNLVNPRIYLAK